MTNVSNNNKKNMNVVNADLFIVPNWAETVKANAHWLGMTQTRFKAGTTYRENLERLFGELEDTDRLVQVWVTDAVSPNWADHGRDGICLPGGFFKFVPMSKLEGLREGDTFEIQWTDSTKLVLNVTNESIVTVTSVTLKIYCLAYK